MSLSVWLEDRGRAYSVSRLEDLEGVEVAIVGGGMAGLAAAYLLSQHRIRVAVLEKYEIGGGSTSFSGGFLTPNSTLDLHEMLREFGRSGGSIYDLASFAVVEIGEAARRERFDCQFERTGALYLAAERSHWYKLQREHEAHLSLGHAAHLFPAGDPAIPVEGVYGALRTRNDCAMNPALFAKGLAAAIVARGGRIVENVSATGIFNRDGHAVLHAQGRAFRFPRIIVAVDGWLRTHAASTRYDLMHVPITSHILVTKPVPGITEWWRGELLRDSYEIYHYLRLLPDSRILVGGEDKWFVRPQHGPIREAGRYDERLLRYLRERFPGLPIEKESSWSEYLSYPIDGLPIFSEDGRIIDLLSDGLPFSWLMGKMAALRILGRPAAGEEYFRPQRSLGLWRELFIRAPLPRVVKKACVKAGIAAARLSDEMDKPLIH